MRRWVPIALLGVLALGCNSEVFVECERKAGAQEFECTVNHKKGFMDVKVCWDVVVSCKNGTKQTAHTCEKVKPKKKAETKIANKEFDNQGKCDVATDAKVENIKMNF